jgi:uncharacterized protein YxjI
MISYVTISLIFIKLSPCDAWISQSQSASHSPHRRLMQRHRPQRLLYRVPIQTSKVPSSTTRRYNMLFDWITGGGSMQTLDSLPYNPPLCPMSKNTRIFAIQERALSWTGEDFDVSELLQNNQRNIAFCNVRGAMLHLPGKDKMRLYSSSDNALVAELDRKLVALTPTYDIYRGDGNEKLGWIERKMIAFTDTFEVHLEGKGGFGPIKPPAAFYLEGDFLDRRFVMKNDKGQVVAMVTKEGN